MKSLAKILLVLAGGLFITACQQIVTPTDVDKDTTRPQVSHISFDSNSIEVSFSEDMVRFGQGRQALLKLPITITPAVGCLWYWHSARGVTCESYESALFKPATTYEVQVGEGLIAASGQALQPYKEVFETARPELLNWRIGQWLSPVRPTLQLTVTRGTDIESLGRRFKVRDNGGQTVDFDLEDITHSQSAGWGYTAQNMVFKVSFKQDLQANTRYTLMMMPGLKTQTGPLRGKGGFKDDNRTFKTYGDFKYLGSTCSKQEHRDNRWVDVVVDADLPCPYDHRLKLQFSTPLAQSSNDTVLTPLNATPFYADWFELGDNVVNIAVNAFAAQSHILLKPSTELVDIFGRKLANPQQHLLKTGDAKPAFFASDYTLVFPDGVKPQLSISSINEPTLSTKTSVVNQDGHHKTATVSAEDAPLNQLVTKTIDIDQQLQQDWGMVYGHVSGSSNWDRKDSFSAVKSPYNVYAVQGDGLLSVWVSDILSGKPVADADVYAVTSSQLKKGDYNGAPLGKTDQSGYITLKGIEREFVVVKKAEMFAVQPLDSAFEITSDVDEEEDSWTVWGVTSQTLYQAGDMLRFKAFIRTHKDNRWALAPFDKTVDVYLTDFNSYPRYRVKVFEGVTFSALGAFDGQWHLPDHLADGAYELVFEVRGHGRVDLISDFSFEVASVKTKEVKVSASTTATDSQPLEPIELSLQTQYFSGGVFADAQIEVVGVVKAVDYNDVFTDFPEFSFEKGYVDDQGETESTPVVIENQRVDRQGLLNTTLTLEQNDILLGQTFIVSSVKDTGAQWISGPPLILPFHSVDNFVGIKLLEWAADVGSPLSFETIVVDAQGRSRKGVDVSLSLNYRAGEDWQQVDSCSQSSELLPTSCRLVAKSAGIHKLIATVTDQHGKSHVSKVSVYTFSKQDELPSQDIGIWLSDSNPDFGQTIDVEFVSPFKAGNILVLLARNQQFKHYEVEVKEHQAQLKLTMDEQLWPGFTIVAYTRRDNIDINNKIPGRIYSASGRATVEIESELPNQPIGIRLDKSAYRPGEKVKLSLQSASSLYAEYTVAVIDEGYISHIADYKQFYDWKSSFYSDLLRYWGAPTSYDLLSSLSIGAEQYDAQQRLKRYYGFNQGLETITIRGSRESFYGNAWGYYNSVALLAPGANESGSELTQQTVLGADRLRTAIKRAALWLPTVKSDRSGVAEVEFTLPDNLTNFKVMVVENRKDGDINFGSTDIPVKQALEIRARLPQQLVEGDDFVASYSIVNQSEQTATQSSELSLLDSATGQWQVQTQSQHQLQSSERFTLSSRVKAEGPFALQLAAITKGSNSDGLINTVPMASLFQTQTITRSGLLRGQSDQINLVKPVDAVSGQSQLRFDFATHFSSQLSGAFDYLEDYPHRCWEQRLSRAIGFAFAKQLDNVGLTTVDWPEAELTRDTLAQVRGFQNSSGGMAFWHSKGAVSNYLSAYTLNAYTWLEPLGYQPDKEQLRNLIRYLSNEKHSRHISITAMTINALSGHNWAKSKALSRFNKLLPDSDKLSLFGLSQMLQAANKLTANHDGLAPKGLKKLKALLKARIHNTGERIELIDQTSGGYGVFGNQVGDLCSLLMAVGGDDQFEQDKRPLINTILSLRNRQGHFGNTQSNAQCIVALSQATDVLSKAEGANPDSVVNSIDVSLAGEQLLQQPVTLKSETASVDVTVDSKPKSLLLQPKTDEITYYQVQLNYPVDLRQQQNQRNGFELTRRYQVYRAGKWVEVDDGQNLQVSEWVRVTLKVINSKFRQYIALSDPVPGGLEPVSTQLSGNIPSYIRQGESNSNWFTERQIKPGTSRFYADWLSEGMHIVQYFAQVTTEGSFSALPARVEAMYDERQYGTSGYRQIRVGE